MADLKPFVFEQLLFIIRKSLNLNREYLRNIEFSGDHKEQVKSLLEQRNHLELTTSTALFKL